MAHVAERLRPHRARRDRNAKPEEDHEMGDRTVAEQNEHSYSHREQEPICSTGCQPKGAQESAKTGP